MLWTDVTQQWKFSEHLIKVTIGVITKTYTVHTRALLETENFTKVIGDRLDSKF